MAYIVANASDATNSNAHQFQGQKVKVTRPITDETESISYLSNGKAYELQNWYADGTCAINCHGQL